MTFKRYDVITFEENDKVVVLAALVHEGNEYVFVNEILPDESDVTDSIPEIVLSDKPVISASCFCVRCLDLRILVSCILSILSAIITSVLVNLISSILL